MVVAAVMVMVHREVHRHRSASSLCWWRLVVGGTIWWCCGWGGWRQ